MRIDVGDGTRLSVDVVGSGLAATPDAMVAKPTLVLLHGGPGGDHSSMRPYFDRFADTHQVLYVDHRGNGRSDGWDQEDRWDLDTWADDIVRLCDALGVAEPVVLGLSFGGFVAQRYAARHPGHASKLVLMSTMAAPAFEATEERFRELGGDAAAANYRRVFIDLDLSIEALLEYLATNMPLYNLEPSGFGPERTLMNLEVLDRFTRWWKAMDLRADVAAIDVPTLVIGGNDDPMTPPACSEEIADLLGPGLGRLELLADCGHGTYRDQPDRTEAILRDFLA